MPLTMHRYPDGRDGLAAICDTCHQRITQHAWIVWNPNDPTDFLVVHQNRCDPGGHGGSVYSNSMPLADEIIYLANSTNVDLKKARQHVALLETIT